MNMSYRSIDLTMNPNARDLPVSLLDLICNSLVLQQLSPYLPIASRLSLASVNKTFRDILEDTPEAHRYVDLSACKGAQVPSMLVDRGGVNWRSQRIDESLTEDDIYCGPLRGIFSKLRQRHALMTIHTLILDGVSVPADLIQEIIQDTNVRILSVREAQHLNHRKLMSVLKYVVRATRPQGTPKLKGFYVFGPKSSRRKQVGGTDPTAAMTGAAGVTATDGAQIGAPWNQKSHSALNTSLLGCEDRWYQPTGRMIKHSQELVEWADTLRACEGVIAFDAVLCRGPRHDITTMTAEALRNPGQNGSLLPPAIANVALGPVGCATCKSMVEGPARYGVSPPEQLPLLDPPPLHSSSIQDAQRPHVLLGSGSPPLIVRCSECLLGRWCERCFKWWDEQCYPAALTGTRTDEVRNAARALDQRTYSGSDDIRIFLGLCIESCLVSEEMNGSGSGGMWG